MMTLKFTVNDLRGVIAVVPTPATLDSSSLKATSTINIKESETMIRKLISDGVDGIITNGTLGEMATLTLEEWQTFARLVIETVHSLKPDLPLFIGATTLNTRDTLARMKYLHELGCRGVFLGRPFWNELAVDNLIQYYQDIANEMPDMSIVIYDNPEAFKGPIPTAAYKAIANIPQVVGIKYIAITPKFKADMAALNGNVRLMPLDSDWMLANFLYPDEAIACWSSSSVCGPAPVLALRDAIFRGDSVETRRITNKMSYATEKFLARINFHEFSKFNIPLEKERFNEAGYIQTGPSRHPYHLVPEPYMEGSRETGRRWRILDEEIRSSSEKYSQMK